MRHPFARILFVAVCGLAPAALGNLLHWSVWQWGFMSMVTTSGSLLLLVTVLGSDRTTADSYEPEQPESPAPVEEPYRETHVTDAALPSAADGYDFRFSATVWWKPIADHIGRSEDSSPALAVSSVVTRARELVRHEEPGRANFAQYLLDGELGVARPDQYERVVVMAADVTLALAPADRERLRKLNNLCKDEELWERERQYERSKRRYLGDDVLKSAGSAVVWWLARHEDEIEKAVTMIGPLAQIASAANDEEVPELFRHLLIPPAGTSEETSLGAPLWDEGSPEQEMFDREEEVGVADRLRLLLDAVGLKPDMDGYAVLVHRVMRSLKAEGLDDAADDIAQGFGPASDETPENPAPAGNPSTGPWPPRSPASEPPPSSPSESVPDTDPFTRWAPESAAYPREEDNLGGF